VGLQYQKNDKISTDIKPRALKPGNMNPFHGSNSLIMQFGVKTKGIKSQLSYTKTKHYFIIPEPFVVNFFLKKKKKR